MLPKLPAGVIHTGCDIELSYVPVGAIADQIDSITDADLRRESERRSVGDQINNKEIDNLHDQKISRQTTNNKQQVTTEHNKLQARKGTVGQGALGNFAMGGCPLQQP